MTVSRRMTCARAALARYARGVVRAVVPTGDDRGSRPSSKAVSIRQPVPPSGAAATRRH